MLSVFDETRFWGLNLSIKNKAITKQAYLLHWEWFKRH